MKCSVPDIRRFLLRLPRADYVRATVEGKFLYVVVDNRTLSQVAETLCALHPERIDLMAKKAPDSMPAMDGVVLRSGSVEGVPLPERVSQRIGAFEARLREVEELARQRERKVREMLNSRLERMDRAVSACRDDVYDAHKTLLRTQAKLAKQLNGSKPVKKAPVKKASGKRAALVARRSPPSQRNRAGR